MRLFTKLNLNTIKVKTKCVNPSAEKVSNNNHLKKFRLTLRKCCREEKKWEKEEKLKKKKKKEKEEAVKERTNRNWSSWDNKISKKFLSLENEAGKIGGLQRQRKKMIFGLALIKCLIGFDLNTIGFYIVFVGGIQG